MAAQMAALRREQQAAAYQEALKRKESVLAAVQQVGLAGRWLAGAQRGPEEEGEDPDRGGGDGAGRRGLATRRCWAQPLPVCHPLLLPRLPPFPMQLELPSNPLDTLIDQLGGPAKVRWPALLRLLPREPCLDLCCRALFSEAHCYPQQLHLCCDAVQSCTVPLTQVAEMTGRKGRLVRSKSSGGVVFEARNASGVAAGALPGCRGSPAAHQPIRATLLSGCSSAALDRSILGAPRVNRVACPCLWLCSAELAFRCGLVRHPHRPTLPPVHPCLCHSHPRPRRHPGDDQRARAGAVPWGAEAGGGDLGGRLRRHLAARRPPRREPAAQGAPHSGAALVGWVGRHGAWAQAFSGGGGGLER